MRERTLGVLLLGATIVALAGCASSGAPAAAQQPASGSADPLYPLTLMRQGSLALQQGRYDTALELFEEARRLQPDNATVYNMIGLCHLNSGRLDKALEAFGRALELIPSFSDARNNRGLTYLALKQYRKAEVDFLGVLADTTYPHRWQVYYNLGMTYLGQGDLAAAEENLRKAAFAPRPVYEAYLRLAQIAERRSDLEGAEALLRQAVVDFPERVEGHLELGRVLRLEGKAEEARAELEKVLEMAPGSELAERARSLLEER